MKVRKLDIVYNKIKEKPYILAKDIAKETGISYNYVRVLVHRLVHDCKVVGIESIFNSRSHEYVINSEEFI